METAIKVPILTEKMEAEKERRAEAKARKTRVLMVTVADLGDEQGGAQLHSCYNTKYI